MEMVDGDAIEMVQIEKSIHERNIMINKQWEACPKCGQDKKYSVMLSEGDKVTEVKCCAKQCQLNEKPKKGKA